jgi:hypothetical protein
VEGIVVLCVHKRIDLSSVNNNSDWYRIQMKLLFDKVGFNHVWENKNSFSKNRLTYAIYKKKLRNDFIKFWEESIKKDITEKKKGNKLRT